MFTLWLNIAENMYYSKKRLIKSCPELNLLAFLQFQIKSIFPLFLLFLVSLISVNSHITYLNTFANLNNFITSSISFYY